MTGVFPWSLPTLDQTASLMKTLSRDELTWLCRQSLEGLAWYQASYLYGSETLVWGVMSGLIAVEDLPKLINDSAQSPATIKRQRVSDGYEADFAIGADFAYAHWLMDSLLFMADQTERVTATLTNVSHLLPLLYRTTKWQTLPQAFKKRVIISSGEQVLQATPFSADFCGTRLEFLPQDAVVTVSIESAPLDDLPRDPITPFGCSNEVCGKTWQKSLNDGIDVPQPIYDHLLDIAKRVLVESSEESRRGAGA